MKKIFLSDGQISSVSDEDYIFLFPYIWNVSNGGYVQAWVNSKKQYMHRIIAERMELILKGKEVDHIDGDKLNNQRNNLRPATVSQNRAGRSRYKNNTSGLKGVSKAGSKWKARIQVNKQYIYLGRFGTPEEAHDAYCEAAEHYFGEFSNRG